MSMIFPGMDPYLEDPAYWKGVHSQLIVYVAERLNMLLRPRFVATVEARVFLEVSEPRSIWPDILLRRGQVVAGMEGLAEAGGVAVLEAIDVDEPVRVRAIREEISQPYIAVIEPKSRKRVVAVIEIVSPSNKCAGPGRDSYREKQDEILASEAHLVEIDLLRSGLHVAAVPEWAARGAGSTPYIVSVNRARKDRSDFEVYPRGLRDRLPKFGLPMAEGARDVPLDLQAVLAKTYEAGAFRDIVGYDQPCIPPLSPDDQAWADGLIRAAIGA